MPRKDDPGPFSKRLTAWIVAIGVVCLIGSMLSFFVAGGRKEESAEANTFSPSAVGHRAFRDLLEDEGIPVVVSRHSTAHRTADASLLIVIEPLASEIGSRGEILGELVREAKCPVLLVLPKWNPWVSGSPPTLYRVARRDPADVNVALRAVDPEARIAAPGPENTAWTTNRLGEDPALADPQVVRAGSGWHTLIASAEGFLVAERHVPTVAILADPDLIANHGLHREPNGRLALDLVRRLRAGTAPVLVDETLHDLGVPESIWSQLFTFPLACATAQAVLAALLLLWAGIRRFGAPEPAPPPFEPGKRFLIDHTARLLESGRHHGHTLVRYAHLVVEDAARRLHAGPAGGTKDARAYLLSAEKRKRMTRTLGALEAEVSELAKSRARDERGALEVADRLERWKQEIVDGSDVRTDAR